MYAPAVYGQGEDSLFRLRRIAPHCMLELSNAKEVLL